MHAPVTSEKVMASTDQCDAGASVMQQQRRSSLKMNRQMRRLSTSSYVTTSSRAFDVSVSTSTSNSSGFVMGNGRSDGMPASQQQQQHQSMRRSSMTTSKQIRRLSTSSYMNNSSSTGMSLSLGGVIEQDEGIVAMQQKQRRRSSLNKNRQMRRLSASSYMTTSSKALNNNNFNSSGITRTARRGSASSRISGSSLLSSVGGASSTSKKEQTKQQRRRQAKRNSVSSMLSNGTANASIPRELMIDNSWLSGGDGHAQQHPSSAHQTCGATTVSGGSEALSKQDEQLQLCLEMACLGDDTDEDDTEEEKMGIAESPKTEPMAIGEAGGVGVVSGSAIDVGSTLPARGDQLKQSDHHKSSLNSFTRATAGMTSGGDSSMDSIGGIGQGLHRRASTGGALPTGCGGGELRKHLSKRHSLDSSIASLSHSSIPDGSSRMMKQGKVEAKSDSATVPSESTVENGGSFGSWMGRQLRRRSSAASSNATGARGPRGSSLASASASQRSLGKTLNRTRKKEKALLIQSIARFSLHAPRCVLGDITVFEHEQQRSVAGSVLGGSCASGGSGSRGVAVLAVSTSSSKTENLALEEGGQGARPEHEKGTAGLCGEGGVVASGDNDSASDATVSSLSGDEDDDDGDNVESDPESISEPLVGTHLKPACSTLEENVSLSGRDGKPIAPSNDVDGCDADDENEGEARVTEVIDGTPSPGLHGESPTNKTKLPPPSMHSNRLGEEPTHCLDDGNDIPAPSISAVSISTKTSSNQSLRRHKKKDRDREHHYPASDRMGLRSSLITRLSGGKSSFNKASSNRATSAQSTPSRTLVQRSVRWMLKKSSSKSIEVEKEEVVPITPHAPMAMKNRKSSIPSCAVGSRKHKNLRIGDQQMLTMPHGTSRDSALLFVDITGFTRLSTLLDVEALSKAINSYFEMIISEVLSHGGDVLKFAGDAIFAEWQAGHDASTSPLDGPLNAVLEEEGDGDSGGPEGSRGNSAGWRKGSTKSLFRGSGNGPSASTGRTLGECATAAAFCGAALVDKFSDFQMKGTRPSSMRRRSNDLEAVLPALNVHCGLGVGRLVGLHVGDTGDGGENAPSQLRREFLFLGDSIDQVSKAGDIAKDGELVASPEAIKSLSKHCKIPSDILTATSPSVIAARSRVFIVQKLLRARRSSLHSMQSMISTGSRLSVYESLKMQCQDMDDSALRRLQHQLALYVHPVVRGEELAKSSYDRGSLLSHKLSQRRHRAEAELRSVYTMFIKADVSPAVTGDADADEELFKTLSRIMYVTKRELDKYKGHLRQFIVDDKGVVLIATFGLRGSTFPNMVPNNALPATFAIHSALRLELNIESRIGATFGKVYCGIVGSISRHEFAVMGKFVNLAARLMSSPQNSGILVDEGVREQSGAKFGFKSLPHVKAKGYAKPVPTFEPLHALSNKKRGHAVAFVGRQSETNTFMEVVGRIVGQPSPSPTEIIFLCGDSGIGKSALLMHITDEIKAYCSSGGSKVVITGSGSNENEELIPLSGFRHIFLGAIRELCYHDETISREDTLDPLKRMVSMRRVPGSAGSAGSIDSVGRIASMRRMPGKSLRSLNNKKTIGQSFAALMPSRSTSVPYFQKLCWVCEKLGFAHEYADIVGSRLLGLDDASRSICTVDGKVPTLEDIVDFLTTAFLFITKFADLVLVIVDDFQWIDSLSWKVIRVLREKGKSNLFLVCSMRAHDSKTLRRMSSTLSCDQNSQASSTEIFLGPLDISDMSLLISKVLGCGEHQLNDSFCTDIYERTGGVPVFCIELLENIKRKNATVIHKSGRVGWQAGAKGEQLRSEGTSIAVMEELFLNRFDSLESSVRKVLQTCAVLGIEFTLSDVLSVQPDLAEADVKKALDAAVSEYILLEDFDDDDENLPRSFLPSQVSAEDTKGEGSGACIVFEDRFFQFSHNVWRNNILKTMLNETRVELHRIVAEVMEIDGFGIEGSDTTTLLELFDHWKECGDFCKAAPLALAVGQRLEEWEALQQSLNLYRDALCLCKAYSDGGEDFLDGIVDAFEMQSIASAPSDVLDFLIRLHIKVAWCFSRLSCERECADTFKVAYAILTTPPASEKITASLVFPIVSGLCLSLSKGLVSDDKHHTLERTLMERFIEEARLAGNPIHIIRGIAIEGLFFARIGNFERALETHKVLEGIYRFERHSAGICEEYGTDSAAESFSYSAQWYYNAGFRDEAMDQIDFVIHNHFPRLDALNVDAAMSLIFPVLVVMKAVGRASDANLLVKKYVINPYRECGSASTVWLPLYNPIVYLLDVATMDDTGTYDMDLLREIESWVLLEENSCFTPAMHIDGTVLNGEICWRLARRKRRNEDNRYALLEKGISLLSGALQTMDRCGGDTFMKRQAQKILGSLEELKSQHMQSRSFRNRGAQSNGSSRILSVSSREHVVESHCKCSVS